jgi:hypothetical protein
VPGIQSHIHTGTYLFALKKFNFSRVRARTCPLDNKLLFPLDVVRVALIKNIMRYEQIPHKMRVL